MNLLETLYFPDTAIFSERQFPLFLLFNKVHLIDLIEPHESDPQDPEKVTVYDDRCCQYSPSPLGEDRDRFLYLINDIKNRKDDYATQLGGLALASMSHSSPKGEDAKHQIMSTILGKPDGTVHEQIDKDQEKVWHARLVLKIAEILDQEQEDVARALTVLEDNEVDLFDKLKGNVEDSEADNLFDDLKKIKATVGTPSAESMQNRINAWFRLTANHPFPDCPIWSTTRPDAAAILIENHTQVHDSAPVSIARIPIPEHIGANIERDRQHTLGFSELVEPLLRDIFTALIEPPPDNRGHHDLAHLLKSWEEKLENFYPAIEYGRITAEFFHFNGPLPQYSGLKECENMDGPSLLALIGV